MSEIQILTELFASRQQILWACPPQEMSTASTALALPVADLGIKRRELFAVTQRSQSTTPTPTHAKSRLGKAVEVEIPGDNSCLFNAVG
jgi:hypothetical protein